jgi:hypothetical protein
MRLNKLLSAFTCVIAAAGALRAADSPEPTGSTVARTYPYSMVGVLDFRSGYDEYVGSGTVVRPYSVLTAAHNLWDRWAGWSTRIYFERAVYEDEGLSRQSANRKYILAGYAQNAFYYGGDSIRTFSRDLGGVRFPATVAEGSAAGWWPNPATLTGPDYNVVLGYGAETHSGRELLSVEPGFAFYRTFGAYYENDSIVVEAGMSGGPVLAPNGNGTLFVVGLVVAGSDRPPSSGVRVLDSVAARFIRTYLR